MYSILIKEKNGSNWFIASVNRNQILDPGGYAACSNFFHSLDLPNEKENEINFSMTPNAGAGFGPWQITFKLIGEFGDVSPTFSHTGNGYQTGHFLFVINQELNDWENYKANHRLLWIYEHPGQPYPGCPSHGIDDLK